MPKVRRLTSAARLRLPPSGNDLPKRSGNTGARPFQATGPDLRPPAEQVAAQVTGLAGGGPGGQDAGVVVRVGLLKPGQQLPEGLVRRGAYGVVDRGDHRVQAVLEAAPAVLDQAVGVEQQ